MGSKEAVAAKAKAKSSVVGVFVFLEGAGEVLVSLPGLSWLSCMVPLLHVPGTFGCGKCLPTV